MFDDWLVDVTAYDPEYKGLLCFIPVEDIETGSPTFVTGMNLLTSIDSFDQGRLRGIIHFEGQEFVDKWCEENKELAKQIELKCEVEGKNANKSI